MIAEMLFAIHLAASHPDFISMEPVARYYYRKKVKRKKFHQQSKLEPVEDQGPTIIIPLQCYTEACPSFDDMWSYLPLPWQRTK